MSTELQEYDLIIINNCPAFYKINLYNEIAKKLKIHVIFLGFSKEVVIYDTYKDDIKFSYDLILDEKPIESRNKISTFFKIYRILKKKKTKKIIYGSYAYIEFLLISLLFPKRKNILQMESAREALKSGWKQILKKILLTRYSKAIVSGAIHKDVLRAMDFGGEIIISKGVGIIYKEPKIPQNKPIGDFSFLYVGRLIEIKNLKFLINVFNKSGKKLIIVGKGEQEKELKEMAKDNIVFLGFQNNKELKNIYSESRFFILPSSKEPWGLVVEEALYNNCVLLLSDMIGSNYELLTEPKTGCIFDHKDENSLIRAIQNAEENYAEYYENVLKFDIDQKDQEQTEAYIKLM